MRWFNNLQIRTKILIGFILVSFITGFIGWIGYNSMTHIMKDQQEIADVRLPSVQSLLIISEAQTAVLVGERGLINKNMIAPNVRNAQYDYIDDAFKRATEAWNIYASLPQTKEEVNLWEKFVPEWDAWKKQCKIIINLSKKKDQLIASGISVDDPELQKIDHQTYEASIKNRDLFLKAENTLNKIIDINMDIAKEANNQGKITYKNAKKTVIIVICFGILSAIALGFFISNKIRNPINKTIDMLKDIAEGEGDLTKRLDTYSKDEIGELTKYFNLFVDKIQYLVSQVKDNADTLTESSNQISLGMDQANQGIEIIASGVSNVSDASQNNASVVEEVTASIEELASSTEVVSKESENTFENSKLILEATNLGEKNILEVVHVNNEVEVSTNEVYNSIKDLKNTSDKIGEIISMITNISEQTNLLALNAAIEAARAGEHGKGFAVVAEEVRKLAEESKQSASEIGTLIYEIQTKSDHANTTIAKSQKLVITSVQKSNDTKEQFKNILESIKEMNEKIQMISNSSMRQSQIATEMTKAMDEISRSTQNHASNAQHIHGIIEEQASSFEEIGASMEELNHMAITLKDHTDQFKVK